MDILSKQEVADLMGVHIRSICYHISKGNLKPIKVKGRLYTFKKEVKELPKKYGNKIKVIFLKKDVYNFLNK
jgi:hypothetical protein